MKLLTCHHSYIFYLGLVLIGEEKTTLTQRVAAGRTTMAESGGWKNTTSMASNVS